MPITVDGSGVEAPGLDLSLVETIERVREVVGDDTAITAQTPQGQLATIFALSQAEVGEAMIELGNAFSIATARGAQLDALGALLGIARLVATRSRVTATLTGTAGVTVPAGSRARTADGATFATVASATLSPTGVAVAMEAVAVGPVAAAAATLTEIVSVLQGWETITNAAAAVPGVAEQSDAEYRQALTDLAARLSTGPIQSLTAALIDAEASRGRIVENATATLTLEQEWPVFPHAILVVAQGGTDDALRRGVEAHRGMGAGTTTAIRGGAPDDAALGAVSNGSITWDGTAYTGLDLSSATTGTARAAALTALLSGAHVAFIDGRYVAAYQWTPGDQPVFDDGAVATAFGLNPDAATAAPGPFVRARARALTITVAVTRTAGFPSDGLNAIRESIGLVVDAYGLGRTVYSNDLLAAVESIRGTRVTALSVQHDSTDVSGVDPPLDALWTLDATDLTITIS